jgi:hypothetical protein
MDTVERIHEDDLKQAAVVEAIFLYNTSERDAMMPRKPFPHPEEDADRNTPLKNLYPTAVDPTKYANVRNNKRVSRE